MANIFESAFMTLKNGMTMYFADSKARKLIEKLKALVDTKYGPDNPPPAGKIWYATCSTASGTGAKTATTTTGDFDLATGSMVRILFTTSNTAANPTISIDGSTAKAIRPISSASGMANKIAAGEVIDLVYDGSNFVMTKGNAATTSFYGITKLNSATNSTSTTEAATPSAVKSAYDEAVSAYNLADSKASVPVAISDGGTGSTTAAGAIKALKGLDLDRGTEIPANADLNSYTTAGVYYCTDSTRAATITNTPTTAAGYKLIVMYKGATAQIHQLAVLNASYYIWERQKDGSNSWSAWKYFISSYNFPFTIAMGGTGATTAANARTNLGLGTMATETAADYLKLSGGTMAGKITFNKVNDAVAYTGTKATYNMIKFKDNTADTYGNGIVIGGGGLVVIGGGESADTIAATHTSGGDEVLDLTSDGDVNVWTNAQSGAGSAKKFTFGANGVLSGTQFSGDGSTLTGLNASNISSGTLSIANGGTGAATAANARTNLDVVCKSGDTITGQIVFDSTAAYIKQKLLNTSNYAQVIRFENATPSSYTYKPHIGFHNTGGNSSNPGVINLVPFGTNTGPWGRADGLSISRDNVKFNGSDVRVGTVAVANGGTGATTAADARTNLGAAPMPTVIVKNTTFAGETSSQDFTVSGSGIVVVFAGAWSDDTNDFGTFQVSISYDGTVIMGEGTRWGTAHNYRLGASTGVPIAVTNGKKITIWARNTKSGTKTFYRRFLCFGCTVS